jgi:hypothetical protein
LADCHRRTSRAACKSRILVSTARDGATVQPLLGASCEAEEKFTVVYLVRSLGLMPEFVSHDWHVQPSCQRPNRGPPRRREFSPGGNTRVRIRLSSKLYKHTCGVSSCQSALPTEFPDDFHIGKGCSGSGCRRAASKPNSRFLTGLSARFGMTWLLGWAL